MTRIALVGTGLVGRAWAISFARAGHEVRLFDPNETVAEEAVAFAADMVPMLAAEDLLDGEDPGAVVQRLVSVRSPRERARWCRPRPGEHARRYRSEACNIRAA